MNLFWWIVSVVLFTPKFCIHLQPHIIKVDISGYIIYVSFANIICCVFPVHVFGEVRKFFSVLKIRDATRVCKFTKLTTHISNIKLVTAMSSEPLSRTFPTDVLCTNDAFKVL